MGAQEEGHTGLRPSVGGGSEAGGPDREPRAGAQAAAEPSTAGGRTATARPAMSSGPEPRTARTPFGIADILGPSVVSRGPSASQLPESSSGPASPLCALEELTSNAFRGPDGHALQPSEGTAPVRSRTATWPPPRLSPPSSRAPPLFTLTATLICPLPSAHVPGLASPAPPLPSPPLVPRLSGCSWKPPAPRGRAGLSRTERTRWSFRCRRGSRDRKAREKETKGLSRRL